MVIRLYKQAQVVGPQYKKASRFLFSSPCYGQVGTWDGHTSEADHDCGVTGSACLPLGPSNQWVPFWKTFLLLASCQSKVDRICLRIQICTGRLRSVSEVGECVKTNEKECFSHEPSEVVHLATLCTIRYCRTLDKRLLVHNSRYLYQILQFVNPYESIYQFKADTTQ